jgi:hypothetical protein
LLEVIEKMEGDLFFRRGLRRALAYGRYLSMPRPPDKTAGFAVGSAALNMVVECGGARRADCDAEAGGARR